MEQKRGVFLSWCLMFLLLSGCCVARQGTGKKSRSQKPDEARQRFCTLNPQHKLCTTVPPVSGQADFPLVRVSLRRCRGKKCTSAASSATEAITTAPTESTEMSSTVSSTVSSSVSISMSSTVSTPVSKPVSTPVPSSVSTTATMTPVTIKNTKEISTHSIPGFTVPSPTVSISSSTTITTVVTTPKIDLNSTSAISEAISNLANVKSDGDDTGNGLSPDFLRAMNELGESILDNMPPAGETIASVAVTAGDIILEVAKVKRESFSGYNFPNSRDGLQAQNATIELPKELFANAEGDEARIITLAANGATEEITNASKEFVNSKILSTNVNPPLNGSTKDLIVLVFAHRKPRTSLNRQSLCSFWKITNITSGAGIWSQEGCEVASSNASHTVCHCYHLTEFSVLFRTNERTISQEHQLALTLLTTIGCCISAVSLILMIMVFFIFRKLLHSDRNVIHLNLAIALLCSNIIFMSMNHATGLREFCLMVSILLFYFFTASFFWMLVEGIYIWVMVVKVFTQGSKLIFYLLIGWGLPAVIVASVAVYARYRMISDSLCWLPRTDHLIWAFIGPVMLILLINVIILCRTLATSLKLDKDSKRLANLKTAARLTLVLLPVLGFTWAVGIFLVTNYSLAWEYVFTVLNSTQGLFVFVFYVLFNAEVRKEFKEYFDRQKTLSSWKQSTSDTVVPTKRYQYKLTSLPHEMQKFSS